MPKAPVKKKRNTAVLSSVEDLHTLGSQLLTIRETRQELSAQDKELKTESDELEEQMLKIMQAAKLESFSTSDIRIGISKSQVARVANWDLFWQFIFRNKASQLLQRRVSDPAWRELNELRKGKLVPGTEAYDKQSISLTVIK